MTARKFAVLVLLALLPFFSVMSARACIWDHDTLAMEAQKFPELPQIIAGRFPRYPSLYYEMRLTRASAQVTTNPDDFSAYDDAGMACERLGRREEAAHWMERKKARLDRADRADPQVREHWYRYHANLGTILAHQWLKNGANRARIAEMKTARDHIAQAIQINPDAHFGREKYQLLAMEWIIDPALPQKNQATSQLHEFIVARLSKGETTDEAVKGISGLIVLGDAWQSVDVFAALAHLLANRGDNYISHLASLRCQELINEGKRSIRPHAPSDAAALLKELRFSSGGTLVRSPSGVELGKDRVQHNTRVYAQLRADAETWHKRRSGYLVEHLGAGRHPDTDPDFWQGFQNTVPPGLEQPFPGEWGYRLFGTHWQRIAGLLAYLVGILLLGLVLYVAARRYLLARQS